MTQQANIQGFKWQLSLLLLLPFPNTVVIHASIILRSSFELPSSYTTESSRVRALPCLWIRSKCRSRMVNFLFSPAIVFLVDWNAVYDLGLNILDTPLAEDLSIDWSTFDHRYPSLTPLVCGKLSSSLLCPRTSEETLLKCSRKRIIVSRPRGWGGGGVERGGRGRRRLGGWGLWLWRVYRWWRWRLSRGLWSRAERRLINHAKQMSLREVFRK